MSQFADFHGKLFVYQSLQKPKRKASSVRQAWLWAWVWQQLNQGQGQSDGFEHQTMEVLPMVKNV